MFCFLFLRQSTVKSINLVHGKLTKGTQHCDGQLTKDIMALGTLKSVKCSLVGRHNYGGGHYNL